MTIEQGTLFHWEVLSIVVGSYRFILDRDGISITVLELWNFCVRIMEFPAIYRYLFIAWFMDRSVWLKEMLYRPKLCHLLTTFNHRAIPAIYQSNCRQSLDKRWLTNLTCYHDRLQSLAWDITSLNESHQEVNLCLELIMEFCRERANLSKLEVYRQGIYF